MKRVFSIIILMLGLLAISETALAQCNQITKIGEKIYGTSAGLELFESQIDKDNNTYVVGIYRSNGQVLDLGSGMVLPEIGNVNHVLLIKFNRQAKPLWYRLFRTNFISSNPTLSIDNSGYIYVTTCIAEPLIIDTINIFLKQNDGLVLKFSPEGKAVWGRGIIGSGNYGSTVWPHNITVTQKANVYVSGYFGGTSARFDNISIKRKSDNSGRTSLFLAKYDSTGKIKWALSEGSSDSTKNVIVDFTRVCTDEDENVYVAGEFKGNSTDLKLGNIILPKSKDSIVLFIAKYTKDGEAVWAKLIKTNQVAGLRSNDLIYNGNGSVYLSFEYQLESRIDSFRFGGGGLRKLGLIRMDTSGKILKTRYLFSSKGSIQTKDIKLDRQGNIYFGGVASGDFDVDGFKHSGDTVHGSFSYTLKTDADFKAIWAYFQDQYNFYEENNCISVDDSGIVNLLISTPSMFSGFDKFYYTQFRNNFSLYPVVTNQNNCYEDQKGEINLRMLEGKRPYTVQWQGGYGSDSVLTGLRGGNYHVAVTDANGCKNELNIKVPAPPELKITAVIKDDYKNRQEGKITLTVNGGTPPYKFQWDDQLHQTTQNAVVLFAGTYKVTITDKNGCVYDSSFTVKNITGIDELFGTKVMVYPNPVSDGQLNIEILQLPDNMILSLYDGIGREVLSRKVTSGSNFHDQLTLTTKGIYILKMEMGGKVLVRKVVVE